MDLSPLKQIYNQQMEIILCKNGLTIPCSLLYDSTRPTACPNCIYDSISKKSSNNYKTDGPIPFTNGQTCPYCLGKGITTSSIAQTETHFVVLTDSKNFIDIANAANTDAQTICSIEYLDQIRKASKAIFNTNIPELTNNIFIRSNEPTPIGLGDNRYIFTNWKRS